VNFNERLIELVRASILQAMQISRTDRKNVLLGRRLVVKQDKLASVCYCCVKGFLPNLELANTPPSLCRPASPTSIKVKQYRASHAANSTML